MFNFIYRMFLRVVFRVRVILDSVFVFVVHPRRRLGGAGGPAAPVGRVREGTPPGGNFVSCDPSYRSFGPLSKGASGGSHRLLLDIPVRTDRNPSFVCQSCGMPVKACRCNVDAGSRRPGGVCDDL